MNRKDVTDPSGLLTPFDSLLDFLNNTNGTAIGMCRDAASPRLFFVVGGYLLPSNLWSMALDGSNVTFVAGPLPTTLGFNYGGVFDCDSSTSTLLGSQLQDGWRAPTLAVRYNWASNSSVPLTSDIPNELPAYVFSAKNGAMAFTVSIDTIVWATSTAAPFGTKMVLNASAQGRTNGCAFDEAGGRMFLGLGDMYNQRVSMVLELDLVSGAQRIIHVRRPRTFNPIWLLSWDAAASLLVAADNSPDGSAHYSIFDVPVPPAGADNTTSTNVLTSFTATGLMVEASGRSALMPLNWMFLSQLTNETARVLRVDLVTMRKSWVPIPYAYK